MGPEVSRTVVGQVAVTLLDLEQRVTAVWRRVRGHCKPVRRASHPPKLPRQRKSHVDRGAHRGTPRHPVLVARRSRPAQSAWQVHRAESLHRFDLGVAGSCVAGSGVRPGQLRGRYGHEIGIADLFADWKTWCEDNPTSIPAFTGDPESWRSHVSPPQPWSVRSVSTGRAKATRTTARRPCRICDRPSLLLDDARRPCHKKCIEDAVSNRQHVRVVSAEPRSEGTPSA